MTAKPKDPTEPIRRMARELPDVAEGTSCTQGSFKVGMQAFLYVGPQGGRYKAMFKLDASRVPAEAIAEEWPNAFQVGSTACRSLAPSLNCRADAAFQTYGSISSMTALGTSGQAGNLWHQVNSRIPRGGVAADGPSAGTAGRLLNDRSDDQRSCGRARLTADAWVVRASGGVDGL